MRDHGGDLERAQARWGQGDWIDLSTGINRVPYPVPALPADAWHGLPSASARARLIATAADVYGTAEAVPLAGAQAAIQLAPGLRPRGEARILAPTYNEHAAAFRAAGWTVAEVAELADLGGADVAILCNPNNPDGRRHDPGDLTALRCGLLIVDESFADADGPATAPGPGRLVLKSFGKFYGLAGLRLGFALGPEAAPLVDAAGPWAVSGPALEIGAIALADRAWRAATAARLRADASRLDRLAARAGWSLVGGTALFRTYATRDAAAAQARLAEHRIWSRIFPYSARWLRLGLPAPDEWTRVAAALTP